MELLDKYVFLKHVGYDRYRKYDTTRSELRRINRETKSQFISDAQRTPIDWTMEPLQWEHFQVVAHRYRKSKMFSEDGTVTNYYGQTIIIDKDSSPLISDTEFDEMFYVVEGHSRDDLFEYQFSNKGLLEFSNKVRKTHACCLDLDSYIGQHLKEVFNLPVYIVDRMWDAETREHYHTNYKTSCKYDRNVIFHQVTSSGDDKEIISTEEQKRNNSILIWVFKDKIVYKIDEGKAEW